MKKILAFLFLIALTGCSKKMLPSEHFNTKDSTTTFLPGNVIVPERSDSVDASISELCDELVRRNELLSQDVDELVDQNNSLWRMVDSVKKLPPIIYKNATGSVAFKPTGNGTTKIICHEDEWKLKYDSAIRITSVMERDSTIHYRNICESGFHSFTVKWFWATVAFIVGMAVYKLRRFIF